MNIKITPSRLSGQVRVPPSKSVFHRGIICGGLAPGKSVISPVILNDDIHATLTAMEALGSKVTIGETIEIEGSADKIPYAHIDANESGSTLRFLIPVAASVAEKSHFIGGGRLPLRPLAPYHNMFETYDRGENELPLTVGSLKGNKFRISGGISSQFITGILLAMPLLKDGFLEIEGELQSKPYVDITIDVMSRFGVTVTHKNYNAFTTSGEYRPTRFEVEQDWSSAAFWLVANALGSNVSCRGLSAKSCQGDRAIYELIEKSGISFGENFRTLGGSPSKITVDAAHIPDLVPILSVFGSFCRGGMIIKNTERLRLKESDRVESTAAFITKLGGKIKIYDNEMHIGEVDSFKGGCTVSSYGDHRIAMAAAIASTRSDLPVVIENADCVSKSYPAFFADFIKTGGVADELNMG